MHRCKLSSSFCASVTTITLRVLTNLKFPREGKIVELTVKKTRQGKNEKLVFPPKREHNATIFLEIFLGNRKKNKELHSDQNVERKTVVLLVFYLVRFYRGRCINIEQNEWTVIK